MRSERARAAAIAVAVLLATAAAAPAAHAQGRAPSGPGAAGGPSADELKAARDLFQEAYRDEQEKRFAPALEKFQRVAAVKESASVRYRIASVLASLGRLRESRDAYRALAASKPSLPAGEQEIADSAAERAQALDRRIPRLVVHLQESAPPDARVTIDGAPIPASTTPRPFELDPGDHVVQASAPSAQSSETKVVLPEGGEVTVTVILPPKVAKVVKPPPPPRPEEPAPSSTVKRDDTVAFVALGAGGVLVVTGIVLLGIREGDVSDIKKACAPTCPSGNRSELESKHDTAQLFGPLGVGLAVVGLAAVGVGGYLLFRPAPRAAALRIGPRAVPGGALLGIGTAF
ncbi:MAG TPA: hypothetical protein VLT33_06485 [Labilithrix sp.]|nr:hypothetical protein [Labilithrix sp.]